MSENKRTITQSWAISCSSTLTFIIPDIQLDTTKHVLHHNSLLGDYRVEYLAKDQVGYPVTKY